MSHKDKQPTVGFWTAAFVVAMLLYALSAIPMIYWHDSGFMPDLLQEPVKWFYVPLHWLMVAITGYGNG